MVHTCLNCLSYQSGSLIALPNTIANTMYYFIIFAYQVLDIYTQTPRANSLTTTNDCVRNH